MAYDPPAFVKSCKDCLKSEAGLPQLVRARQCRRWLGGGFCSSPQALHLVDPLPFAEQVRDGVCAMPSEPAAHPAGSAWARRSIIRSIRRCLNVAYLKALTPAAH